jgi:phosphoribosylformimino-5-aminoimidazole carboxamide ribonucleotide (ProFAR) isomerase
VGDEIPVQLGGGIRDLDTIERYIDGGLRYVIIGTAAVKNPGFLKDACTAFGGHIIVGLDAKDGKVATDGWSKLTGHEVVDLAQEVRGLRRRIHRLHRHRPRRHADRHQHRRHGEAGAVADHPVIASGGLGSHRRHREAVRGRGRGHRRRDLRPRDLFRRPRFRRRRRPAPTN